MGHTLAITVQGRVTSHGFMDLDSAAIIRGIWSVLGKGQHKSGYYGFSAVI